MHSSRQAPAADVQKGMLALEALVQQGSVLPDSDLIAMHPNDLRVLSSLIRSLDLCMIEKRTSHLAV